MNARSLIANSARFLSSKKRRQSVGVLSGLSFIMFPLCVSAQQAPPPAPIPVPAELLQHIATYLQDGGSHNEGNALNKAIFDAITTQRAQQEAAEKLATLTKKTADEIAALTKERDELKVAKAAQPPVPGKS